MAKNRGKVGGWLEIFLLFIVPVTSIKLGLVSIERRWWLVLLVVAVVVGTMIKEKWTLKRLGLVDEGWKKSLVLYSLILVSGVVCLQFLAQLLGRQGVPGFVSEVHFKGGFLIVSSLQELVYRSFLMSRLKVLVSSPWMIIGINAALFSLLHVIFPGGVLILLFGFLAGLIFAASYWLRPNLIMITIVHSVLNFVAVYYCFFSFYSGC